VTAAEEFMQKGGALPLNGMAESGSMLNMIE